MLKRPSILNVQPEIIKLAQAVLTRAACLYLQVVEEEVPLPSSEHHSPEFVDLVKQCLEKDPYRRPTAEALMAHPFLQKVPRINIMFLRKRCSARHIRWLLSGLCYHCEICRQLVCRFGTL